MMKLNVASFTTLSGVISVFAVLVTAGCTTPAYTGAELANDAKLNISEARIIAHNARHGQIVLEELEKMKGGSGLRYSFDFKDAGVVYEVAVDAQTGKVLENDVDKHPD